MGKIIYRVCGEDTYTQESLVLQEFIRRNLIKTYISNDQNNF